MKSDSASLYVKGYDLLLWLTRFVEKLPRSQRLLHGDELLVSSRAFVLASSLGLNHPRARADQLAQADEALERLRLALRVAGDCGVLADRQRHFLMPQVDALGRMLGGWRKQELLRQRLDALSAETRDFPGDREEGEVNDGSPGHPGGRLEQ